MKISRPISVLILFLTALCTSVQAQENTFLDNRFASASDLKVTAGAISLQLQRRLAPEGTGRGLLGIRWRLNWESRLSRADRLIRITDWDGVVSFTQVDQQSRYMSSSGEQVTIRNDGQVVRSIAGGGSETFNAAGRLIERVYHHGNKVLLRYDARGRLARVEGPGGSFLRFTTDSLGRVIQVDSSTGATVRYAYDNDNLVEAQVNGGPALRYAYDARGQLAKIEDPQTGPLEIAYDAKGRVTSYRWGDGSQRRHEYDDATNSKRVIGADGATTTTQETSDKRRAEVTDPLGHKSVIQFDEAARPVIVTGPTGASSLMSYDALGRIAAVEDALGRATRYEYAGNSATVTAINYPDGTRQEFEYDSNNDLTAIKLGGKIISALAYSPDGQIATAKEPGARTQKFDYYPNGLVKSATNALGATTQFEYDARGNLTRETNPLEGVTVRSYDAQDHLVSVTSPAGETTRYEYDSRGRLTRETDPAGGITAFEYDARGRLIAETNPSGQVTRYEYTPVDQIAKVIHWNNQTETYRYDLAGNLTARTDRVGRTTTFEYDPAGRVSRERWPSGLEVRYRYDAAGNLLAIEDSTGAKSGYQVDASGKTTLRINPQGGKTQYRYDSLGNLVAVTDPLGGVRQFGYTADGEMAQAAEASRDKASYEYDAAGRVVSITRPSGGVTHFTYDKMSNLLTATDPLGNVKRYSYDNAGHLLTFTDAANRVTRYLYDKAGRQVEKQLPDGKRVAYKYDALGRMIEANDGAFPVRISYDEAGHLKQVTYIAIHKAVTYEYDAQGFRTKLLVPDGREIGYEYDTLKRLSALVLPDGKKIAFSYDAKNRIQAVVYPNGLTGRWDYNADGQVAKISYQDKLGKAVAGSSYRYDAAGNAVERKDAQGQTFRFAYDPAGQLIEETNSAGAIKYSYGAGGNRARVEEGTQAREYKHNAADQLIQAGTEQLSYDANGNLITRKDAGGATAYEYDAENRLVKAVTADGTTLEYGYAPTGERVWRRDKNGVTYFIHDGFSLIAELDNELRTKTMFVHGLGIDRPLAMLQEKQSYYYVADRMGSITQLTDDAGQAVASYVYDAFGKPKARQGTVRNPFAYTGRELDETGLYYYRARYYDAALGRFLSNDLIAVRLDEPLEQNPYLYVRNNPVRFVDPLGLDGYTPEWLASQTPEVLQQLFSMTIGEPGVGAKQIYAELRGRDLGNPRLDYLFYHRVMRQPDGTVKFGWVPGSPPDVEGIPAPGSQPAAPAQQVVARPGQVGPPNPNPPQTDAIPAPRGNPTGEVNGGSPNRAGANTDAVRPQPGSVRGGNTLQDGEARPGGNTLVSPSAPGAGNGFWTLDPKTVRPGLTGAGTVAGIISTAVDCYRNGLSNCGPKIATGIVVAGIITKVVGKEAAGPIGTLIAGGKAWWEIGKELSKESKDQQQRDAEAKAREEQAKENLKNRDDFYGRIEKLRGQINALKKPHDTTVKNLRKAEDQSVIAAKAALVAQIELDELRKIKQKREDSIKEICWLISQTQPDTKKQQLDALAAQAERTQRESDLLFNQARQLAANCGSAADAQAIREQIKRRAALLDQLKQFKRHADTQNADLEQLRKRIADFKGQLQANVTVNVADRALDADEAAKEVTGLMMQVRAAIEALEAGKKLRREINALQAATPEALLADIQDRFNELHGLLSSLTEYAPPDRYDEKAQANANRAAAYRDEALRVLESWKNNFPCNTEIPTAEAAMQRINTALVMTSLDDTTALLGQAQGCESSTKCIPVINQARELIERLEIEEGEAAINQARQQGCNVTGLENTLAVYRGIREAAAALFNAKEQCKFREGLAFAQKMPASVQNNPWIANGIEELRAGLAAQQQVEQYIASATNASNKGSSPSLRHDFAESRKLFAQADGYVAQADQAAAPYPCLVERVNRYKDEYNRLKKAVNNGQDATTDGSSEKPTDEVPDVLGKTKGKNASPTDDVPDVIDPKKEQTRVDKETQKPPSKKVSIPNELRECEGGFCGTWTLKGNQFQAVWDNGAKAMLTIEQFDDKQVVITRNDTGESVSKNFRATYIGRLSGKRIVDGKVTWTQDGRTWSGTWSADW